MNAQKRRAATRQRNGVERRTPGILSRRDITRFASTVRDSQGSEVLLALILIMEDLLSDDSIGKNEWQAALNYLIAEQRQVGFRKLVPRIIAALDKSGNYRQAARGALQRILEIGYEMNPFDCPSSEPGELVKFLRTWIDNNDEYRRHCSSEVSEGGMELKTRHETRETRESTKGLTPLEIKFLIYEKWGSITAAAREIGCSRSQLSYCISRKRITPKIREKVARALGKMVEELFGAFSEGF
ncbi:MAG: hypothetical protein DMF61_22005 [Blastocatellia bacterium AA13]|nr:MAG: hypothetical protein DMF61_22005 [Blastocatellia bacterium AA13]